MKEKRRRVPPTARIAEFPKTVADQARWWEDHILEVLHGLPPDAPQGAVPRPEFDPRRRSLAERERAKADELTAAGHPMTASGIKQRRQRYHRDGLVGLADGRSAKQLPTFGRIAPAVVEAMRQAIAETADASSRTVRFTIWRTKQIVASREDSVGIELPTERTLYRLFDKLAAGTHANGSATTRRSVHARPAGPFGEVPAVAPGELMQIDSSPLDVLVRLDNGIAEKAELTALVDIASRSITAAVLRPTTKAADASVLMARSITPETMRPGWPEALRMSRSVLPHERLLALDERLEHALRRQRSGVAEKKASSPAPRRSPRRASRPFRSTTPPTPRRRWPRRPPHSDEQRATAPVRTAAGPAASLPRRVRQLLHPASCSRQPSQAQLSALLSLRPTTVVRQAARRKPRHGRRSLARSTRTCPC
ncbi:hypothetical protein [Streptomyces mirabilis]|uniref:hypothetical protein n=1 Tax=Streptomyces mirabilis TaxID=68239 RepID=UPI00332A90BF